MQNQNESGSEEFLFIIFMKHVEDDTSDGRKKTAKKSTFFQKIGSEFLGNGKDEVSVLYVNDFE